MAALLRPSRVSLSLCGLDAPGVPRELRGRLSWAASAGYHGVQLDAAAPDCRARNLDRSARRDLASTIRRNGLLLSGLDLWIPPHHLTDAERADRAAGALMGAIELASDLAALLDAPPIVSIALPRTEHTQATLTELLRHAERYGSLLANHAWPPGEPAGGGHGADLGIDPAELIHNGSVPDEAVPHYADRILSLRLSDSNGSSRVPPGTGRLDTLAYIAAIATVGDTSPIVVDVRGLRDPAEAARSALASVCGG